MRQSFVCLGLFTNYDTTYFGHISVVGLPIQLPWITKPVITNFSACDRLLISHDFRISAERQMTIKDSMFEINLHLAKEPDQPPLVTWF